jgi:hypothetical protein
MEEQRRQRGFSLLQSPHRTAPTGMPVGKARLPGTPSHCWLRVESLLHSTSNPLEAGIIASSLAKPPSLLVEASCVFCADPEAKEHKKVAS